MASIQADCRAWIAGAIENSNNAEAVIRASRRFGAPLQHITKSDLIREVTVFQIGVAPRRIDIITTASGLEFDEALSHALPVDIVGIRVHIPSVADLIRYRRASGRTKDPADAEAPENL